MPEPLPSLEGTRVLLTGGTGFIGRYTAEALVEAGAHVRALHRSSSDTRHLRDLGVTLVEGDVLQPDTLDVGDADAVVHLAAQVAFGLPKRLRERMVTVNVEGTRHVLDAAAEAGVERFVHVSSIAVIGATRGRVATETSPRASETKSVYEVSKTQAHDLAESRAGDFDTLTLPMPGVVLGLGGPFDPLLKMYAGGWIRVRPRDDAPSGYVHVRDVADGIVRCTSGGEGPYLLVDENLTATELFQGLEDAGGQPTPRWTVGTGTLHAVAGLAEALWRPLGREPPVARETVRGLANPMRYDSTRAREELGWDPDLWGHAARDLKVLQDG